MNRSNLHEYQQKAIGHILHNTRSALFLDMGLGKTVSTLTAVVDLMECGLVGRTLVIAPKRVAEATWPDEVSEWEHLRHLRVSVIGGTEKQRIKAIKTEADVYTIGRDNLVWLISQFNGRLPYDVLVIDELSSFKNHKSKRFVALRKVVEYFAFVVALTGTPAPNGLIDLWPQIYLLDKGERLGKNIGMYRETFFSPGASNGAIVYNYKPKTDAESRISEAIKDICLSMQAEDYLNMPDKVMIYDRVKLSAKGASDYKEFEKSSVIDLVEEAEAQAEINGTPFNPDKFIVSPVTAAVLSNKLQQFANGAIYNDERVATVVHDEKIEKLKELVEAANGNPVLVAYSFRHDLSRIMEALKEWEPVMLTDGQCMKDWNDGKIQVLVTHPASAGHGLNLQRGGNIIIWFGNTWSLELYLQFNARLYRQGQTKPVYIHHIITEGTIDTRIVEALARKKSSQDGLLSTVKQLIKEYYG